MALRFTRDAQKRLTQVPRTERDQILKRLQDIAADPAGRHPATTQLVDTEGAWRVRQRDWRAVYEIVGGDIVVIRLGHRREVYR